MGEEVRGSQMWMGPAWMSPLNCSGCDQMSPKTQRCPRAFAQPGRFFHFRVCLACDCGRDTGVTDTDTLTPGPPKST